MRFVVFSFSITSKNNLVLTNKQQRLDDSQKYRPTADLPEDGGLSSRLFVWLLYMTLRVMVSDVFAHNCHFPVKSRPQIGNSDAIQQSQERSQRLWKSNPKDCACNLSASFQHSSI